NNMSNNNFPVNATEEAVLVRDGKPDYTKLEASAFPTPTADEAGAILENSDTGNRYRWTGAVWVQISVEGQMNITPKSYEMEVASGNITGDEDERFTGRCLNISSTAFETLWDQGGDLTYLTSDTQLYISSSSASDTTVLVRVEDMTDDYERITYTVQTNGQTQVALPGLSFRTVQCLVLLGSDTPVGDLYIAESDTLTLGVPDTASKIKSKIALAPFDAGEFASTNITHNGFFTVPAGKRLHSLIYLGTTAKDHDITADLRVRAKGGAWLSIFMNWAYQSVVPIELINRGSIGAESDIQIRVKSGNPDGEFEANFQFILRDDT
ncbi:MAG: hypothetical protein JKY95_19825, partial [Planctomycetaceae bacterium]|nr:hypothetical protein [Planctomycetaceae bacterium]